MNKGVFERYAEALLEVTHSERKEKEVLEELSSFLPLVEGEEFCLFFFCPTVDQKSKRSTLEEILKNIEASSITKNFISLLCEKQRLQGFKEIVSLYKKKLYAKEGFYWGTVRASQNLKEDELSQVKLRLEQVLKKKIVVETKEEGDLMGGLSVDILGKRFNNSVLMQAEKLKEYIEKGY